MRAILAAIEVEPDQALTVDDFCAKAFPGTARIEKKHRVAVTRAMWTIVGRRSDLKIGRVWPRGRTGPGRLALYRAANPDALIIRRRIEQAAGFRETF